MKQFVRRVVAAYPEFFLAWLCYSNAKDILAGGSVDGYIAGVIIIELLGFVWLKLVLARRDGTLVDRSLLGLGRAAVGMVTLVLLGSFVVLALFALLLVNVPLLVLLVVALGRRQLWFWSWRIDAVQDSAELDSLYRRSSRVHLLAITLACFASVLVFWFLDRPESFNTISDALSLAGMAGYFTALGIYLLAGRHPRVQEVKQKPATRPEIPVPAPGVLWQRYRERWFMLMPWVGVAWLILMLMQRLMPGGLFIMMLPWLMVVSCLPLFAATVDAMGYHVRSPLAFAWRRRGASIYAAFAILFCVWALMMLSVPFVAGLLGLSLGDDLIGSGRFMTAMMIPLALALFIVIRLWPIVVLPFLVDDEQVPDGELVSQCKLAWTMTAGFDGAIRGGASPFIFVGPMIILSLVPSPYFWSGQIAIFGLLLPLLTICMVERCLVMARLRTDFDVFTDPNPSGEEEEIAWSDSAHPTGGIPIPIPVPIPIPGSGPRDKPLGESARNSTTRAGHYQASQSDEEVLFEAAMNGDLTTVKQKLALAVPIESTFRDLTLVIHAAFYGQKEIVRLLLARGANPLAREPVLEASLLHLCASIEGAAELVAELIVEHKLNIEDVDRNGMTPLFNAISAGHVDTIQTMLALGANPLRLNYRGESTLQAFLNSYSLGKKFVESKAVRQLMTELIQRGVDPHHVDSLGRTAIHVAAMMGSLAMLQHLDELGIALDVPDPGGVTPMQAAVAAGQLEVVKFLGGGAAPKDLHTAVRLGDIDAARSILEMAPEDVNLTLDAEGSDISMSPPVFYAIGNGDMAMINLLLDHGADPSIHSRHFGGVMFHLAKHIHDYDIALRLLVEGADPECPDGDSNSALNMAARYDNLPVAKALLEAGADPNSETERGYRVLAWAKGKEMQNLLTQYGGIYTGGPY